MFVTLAIVYVGVLWVAPVSLSFYAAKTAPAVTSIVPTNLKDKSISKAPGQKLSYLGYEFEVPWSDLDDTQTRLYPKDNPDKTRVDLHFRLRLWVTAIPPRSWINEFSADFKVPPQRVEASFGGSDYSFVKTLYEFAAEKMHHWTSLGRGESREEFLLLIKSIALKKSAESGIFSIQNEHYKGFQEGNPRVHQEGIVVDLFSDEGGVKMVFSQEDYRNFTGVTQPEINRIVQSLRKVSQNESPTPSVAQSDSQSDSQ